MQPSKDLDADGWLDLPAFDRIVARPRIFFDNGEGTTLFATAGVMAEDRSGGTLPGATVANGLPFPEALNSRHVDAGFAGRWLVQGSRVLSIRGSLMRRTQDRLFGDGARVRRAPYLVRRRFAARCQRSSHVGCWRGSSTGEVRSSRATTLQLPVLHSVGVRAGRGQNQRQVGRGSERPGRSTFRVRIPRNPTRVGALTARTRVGHQSGGRGWHLRAYSLHRRNRGDWPLTGTASSQPARRTRTWCVG